MPERSLSQWLLDIEQQHGNAIELGLERIAEVAARLGLGRFAGRVVTVAGTNGKGSFVAGLAAILQAHGLSTCCYTSPHLLHFNERIVIDGRPASDADIVAAFERVEQARQDTALTYFEFTTLAALLLMAEAATDVVILEVGLGGRLDAVNIIEPDIAVITSIDLDHQAFLGDTRAAIAAEKAGILRQHTPLYCAEADFLALCPAVDNGRLLVLKDRDFTVTHSDGHWQMHSPLLAALPAMTDNGLSPDSLATAALVAASLLGEQLQPDRLSGALASASLPGRFQRFVRDGVELIVDVAHNRQAAALLHRRLGLQPAARRLAVLHLLNDKDVAAIVAELAGDFAGWFVGGLAHPRASDGEYLADTIRACDSAPVSISKNLHQALARALSLSRPGDQIVVFGSFFVAAELLPGLQRR